MSQIKIVKENKMTDESPKGIMGLIGKKMTKTVKFHGSDITISKLSVSNVLEIQSKTKTESMNDAEGFEILKTVIRNGVEGGSDLSDQDFENFALDELSKLSTEVLKFSGIGQDLGK